MKLVVAACGLTILCKRILLLLVCLFFYRFFWDGDYSRTAILSSPLTHIFQHHKGGMWYLYCRRIRNWTWNCTLLFSRCTVLPFPLRSFPVVYPLVEAMGLEPTSVARQILSLVRLPNSATLRYIFFIFFTNGRSGGTRTRTGIPIGSLVQRVYQFRHAPIFGPQGRTRTGTVLLPTDFESVASTDFTTWGYLGTDIGSINSLCFHTFV